MAPLTAPGHWQQVRVMPPPPSLTGRWHGVYSYPAEPMPVYFVADLIQTGDSLSGSTEEAEKGQFGEPLTLTAHLSGTRAGMAVTFTKTYDGTGGWSHSVEYGGALSADGLEIDGRWAVPGVWSGSFLMIRAEGASEAMAREAYAQG